MSIVTASRNDEAGHNSIKAITHFIKGIAHLSAKYQLPTELLIVEWNPPAGKLRLSEAIGAVDKNDFFKIRFIIVPAEIHQRYSLGNVIPLFEMIAKNAGIRRANGEFVLCTNPDVFISEELFKTISRKNLAAGKFYRANRCDIPNKVDTAWGTEQMLDFAGKNILKRYGKDFRYHNIPPGAPSWIYDSKILPWALNKLSRWKKRLIDHPLKTKFNDLDTNHAADFTLMSKTAWHDMQGYLELDLSAVNLDVLSIIATASLGYEQELFEPKACVYHLSHADEFDTLTPFQKIKFYEQSPGVSYEIVWSMVLTMLKEKQKFNINKPNWGFADLSFEEVVW